MSLLVLFIAETLERFAFYVLVSVVTLYLVEHRGLTVDSAFRLYGTMMALAYLAPLVGGIVADRVLRQMRAVILGAALLGVGYTLLLVDSSESLYAAIGILAAGLGLFKPAMPAVLANLYPRLDARRETAFILFFMGMQLGAFLAPITAEATRQRFGWSAVLALSAGAMVAATLLLTVAGRSLSTPPPNPAPPAEPPIRWSALLVIYLIWIFHSAVTGASSASLPLFVRDHVDLTFGGRFSPPMSPSLVTACEPIFQFLSAPLVILGFLYLRRRRLEPSSLAKIGIGMVLTVLPCLLMARGALLSAGHERISMFWILGTCMASALPTLFLMPIVLTIISQLAPGRHLGTLFSIWFVLTAMSTKAANALRSLEMLVQPPIFYGTLGLISLATAGLWISQVRRIEAALRAN